MSAFDDALRAWAAWLPYARRQRRVPGVQAAVWRDGDVVLSAAHGVADETTGTPLREDHLFRVASHSKTFTATVVLQLAEEGRLRLDDTLGDLLGATGGTRGITVRELLSHTSGMSRDGLDGDHWQLTRAFPDHDAVAALLHDPDVLVLERQERFKYSNLAYGLLGLVVERATGGSWADAVRSGVVDRLGLTRTIAAPLPGRPDLVTGHTGLGYAEARVPFDDTDAAALGAATGVCSTARDLVRYLGAHVDGDALLPRAARHEMHRGSQETGGGSRYGLGMSAVTAGERSLIGHNGGWPGQITSTLADGDARIAVSVLTNAIDGPAEALVRRFYALLDLAEAATPDSAAGRGDLDRFTGLYASLWGVTEIAVLGGRLHQLDPTSDDPGERSFALGVVDGSSLRVEDGPGYGSVGELLRYTFAADGSVERLRGSSATTLRPLDRVVVPERVRLGHRP